MARFSLYWAKVDSLNPKRRTPAVHARPTMANPRAERCLGPTERGGEVNARPSRKSGKPVVAWDGHLVLFVAWAEMKQHVPKKRSFGYVEEFAW